jgi:ectoine hydroxylase-related dioxygenase (phytanoyl-CoA dioxygenase family)
MQGMLTEGQIADYGRDGYFVVPNVLSDRELGALRQVTDDYVEESRAVANHNSVYDLESGHSAEQPRVRRIKHPHRQHAVYAELTRNPIIIGVLQSLWGPNIRFHSSKLNMKSAGFGSPVEWHQDWAFYPHTNDDLAAVGIMLDDCNIENGPLLIIPRSHCGPILDHHSNGRFCGAINHLASGVDFSKAVPLTGKAGTITVHHVRAIHGSAPNLSSIDRRLLLFQYGAADAWPIFRVPTDIDAYNAKMVAGEPTIEPRMAAVPVRIPLPSSSGEGSIYVRQEDMAVRYFSGAATAAENNRQPEIAR